MAAPPPAPSASSPPESEALVVVTVNEPAEGQSPPPPGMACDNNVGEVSCDFITPDRFRGPACEGFQDSCDLLKDGYG